MGRRTSERVQAVAQSEEKGNSRPPLSPDLLKRLYCCMVKCRMTEERAGLLPGHRISGSACLATGREATEVGATIDLNPEDLIAPSQRSVVAHVMKDCIHEYLLAADPARTDGRNGLGPASIAAQLNIATGVALAYRMQKRSNVVVAISDDTSASLEGWHEPLAFAASHKLPIVYVAENNLWAEPGQAAAQRADEELSAKAQAYGFPVITVDGNDVVAVYRVCYEARERARQGYGPTLVESRTCRWPGYGVEPTPKQVEQWNACDPIPAMERYLRKHDLWDDARKRQLLRDIKQELDDAVKAAKKLRRSGNHRSQVYSL